MTEPEPLTLPRIFELAARGAGKVDRYGQRGVTLVSLDELTAMALALALLGLKPIPPGSPAINPIDHPINPLKGPDDV